MNAFVNDKNHSALQKEMKKLVAKQKVKGGKITALGTQILSIAHTTLKEIERFQTYIVESNKRLEMLTQYVMSMQVIIDKFIWKVGDIANAIRCLNFILGRISANMKRICQNINNYWQN